jgi:hypothetical protein
MPAAYGRRFDRAGPAASAGRTRSDALSAVASAASPLTSARQASS